MVPFWLPSINGSRSAKVQIIDVLVDNTARTLAAIVNDPQHDRNHMYRLSDDTHCVFPTGSGLARTPMQLK